jgi:hypothetical protein
VQSSGVATRKARRPPAEPNRATAEAAVNANRHETPISEERLLPVDAVAGTGMAPAR